VSGCPLVDSERYKTLVDITRLPDNVVFDRLAINGHCIDVVVDVVLVMVG